MNDRLENIPEIDFIDGLTVEQLINDMITDYQDAYYALTGKKVTLSQADPYRLILYTCAIQIYQGMLYADRAGKLNMLKYSYGAYLDNLVALRGVTRKQAAPAVTVLRFEIDAALQSAVSIPAGTRATNGNEVYFATDEYAEIAPGETYVEITATCTEAGASGNGFIQGDISTLVEPIPYITSVENVSETANGSDAEDDNALAERAYLASGAFSTAGPARAYEYWAKTYSQQIGDVKVTSPNPCEVDIVFLMKDGSLPTQTTIDGLQAFLEDENVRPLTDLVTVDAPDTESFNIDMTYYINSSDTAIIQKVRDAVEAAVDEYVAWQSGKIGRDINPSILISKVIAAGAKRAVITQPEYTSISEIKVARLNTRNVTYGGVEND